MASELSAVDLCLSGQLVHSQSGVVTPFVLRADPLSQTSDGTTPASALCSLSSASFAPPRVILQCGATSKLVLLPDTWEELRSLAAQLLADSCESKQLNEGESGHAQPNQREAEPKRPNEDDSGALSAVGEVLLRSAAEGALVESLAVLRDGDRLVVESTFSEASSEEDHRTQGESRGVPGRELARRARAERRSDELTSGSSRMRFGSFSQEEFDLLSAENRTYRLQINEKREVTAESGIQLLSMIRAGLVQLATSSVDTQLNLVINKASEDSSPLGFASVTLELPSTSDTAPTASNSSGRGGGGGGNSGRGRPVTRSLSPLASSKGAGKNSSRGIRFHRRNRVASALGVDTSPAANALRSSSVDDALATSTTSASTNSAQRNSGTLSPTSNDSFPGSPQGFLSLLSNDERGLLKDAPSVLSSSPDSDPSTSAAAAAVGTAPTRSHQNLSRFASLLPSEWLDKDSTNPSPRGGGSADSPRLSPVEKMILTKKAQRVSTNNIKRRRNKSEPPTRLIPSTNLLELLGWTIAHHEEKNHRLAFLAAYKDFVSPSKLLGLWIGIFEAAHTEAEKDLSIRFLCEWLNARYAEDFYHNPAANVLEIILDMPDLGDEDRTRLHMLSVKGLREAKVLGKHISIQQVLQPEARPDIIHLNIVDMPSKKIALALSQTAWQVFRMIRLEQMKLVVNRERPNRVHGAIPPVQVLSRYFSRVASWVVTEIVTCTSVAQAVIRLGQMILIMKHLKALNNFDTLLAICAGLKSPFISRLSEVWKRLPDKSMAIYRKLLSSVSPHRNFRAYRHLMIRSVPPIIPFMVIMLRDVASCLRVPKYLDAQHHVINETYVRSLGKMDAALSHCQSGSLPSLNDDNLLLYARVLPHESEEKLFFYSGQLERVTERQGITASSFFDEADIGSAPDVWISFLSDTLPLSDEEAQWLSPDSDGGFSGGEDEEEDEDVAPVASLSSRSSSSRVASASSSNSNLTLSSKSLSFSGSESSQVVQPNRKSASSSRILLQRQS